MVFAGGLHRFHGFQEVTFCAGGSALCQTTPESCFPFIASLQMVYAYGLIRDLPSWVFTLQVNFFPVVTWIMTWLLVFPFFSKSLYSKKKLLNSHKKKIPDIGPQPADPGVFEDKGIWKLPVIWRVDLLCLAWVQGWHQLNGQLLACLCSSGQIKTQK